MKPRMFVSSSVEGREIAHAVHHNLQDVAEVTVWDQDVVEPSSTVLDSLESHLDKTDFALFVFSPDDVVTVRGEENPAARNNVILELGIFTGRLGRKRCFTLVPDGGGMRIPSDLLGITCLKWETGRRDNSFTAAVGPACSEIRQAIRRLGSRADAPSLPAEPDEPAGDAEEPNSLEAIVESSEKDPAPEADQYRWLHTFVAGDHEGALRLLQERIDREEDEKERIDLEGWIGRIRYEKAPREGQAHLVNPARPSRTSPTPCVRATRKTKPYASWSAASPRSPTAPSCSS
jgi:hypothetical protein